MFNYQSKFKWLLLKILGTDADNPAAGNYALFGLADGLYYRTSAGVSNRLANRKPSVQSVVSAATVTPTFSDDQVNITGLATGVTLANWTGTAVDGWGVLIRIYAAGAQSIAVDTKYRAIGVTIPIVTVAGKVLYMSVVYNAADDKYDVLSVSQQA